MKPFEDIEEIIRSESFPSKYDKEDIVKILSEAESLSKQDSIELMEKLSSQYGASSVNFLPFIRVKSMKKEDALSILEKIPGIPVLSAIFDKDQSSDDDDGIGIDYEFYYKKMREEIKILRQCILLNTTKIRSVEPIDVSNDILEKYFKPEDHEVVKYMFGHGLTIQKEAIVRALSKAILNNDLENLKILFQFVRGKERTNVFGFACENGTLEVLNMLFELISTIDFSYDTKTALMNIITNSKIPNDKCYDFFSWLLKHGCTIHIKTLSLAVRCNRELIVTCMFVCRSFPIKSVKKLRNKGTPSIRKILQKIIKLSYGRSETIIKCLVSIV